MKITTPMNECGYIIDESLAVLGNSATNCNFNYWCGFEKMDRLVLSNPHSS